MDPMQLNQSRGERCLRHLFNRPWLAALVVGSAIHALATLDLWLFGPGGYLLQHWQLLADNPAFGATQILIPYLVPWAVTSVANHLNCRARECLMEAFPEANPDLVIRLDDQGNPVYANRQVRELLKRLGTSEQNIEAALPPGYRQRLFSVAGNHDRFRLRHQLAGREVEYLVQREYDCSGSFVSGRILER